MMRTWLLNLHMLSSNSLFEMIAKRLTRFLILDKSVLIFLWLDLTFHNSAWGFWLRPKTNKTLSWRWSKWCRGCSDKTGGRHEHLTNAWLNRTSLCWMDHFAKSITLRDLTVRHFGSHFLSQPWAPRPEIETGSSDCFGSMRRGFLVLWLELFSLDCSGMDDKVFVRNCNN